MVQSSGETSPSKDQDARWIKQDGKLKSGYQQHTRTDSDSYIEKLHITLANAHECNHFEILAERHRNRLCWQMLPQ